MKQEEPEYTLYLNNIIIQVFHSSGKVVFHEYSIDENGKKYVDLASPQFKRNVSV